MLLLNIGTPDVHVLYNVYLMSVNPGCKPGGFVSYCLFALFASFCLQCIFMKEEMRTLFYISFNVHTAVLRRSLPKLF